VIPFFWMLNLVERIFFASLHTKFLILFGTGALQIFFNKGFRWGLDGPNWSRAFSSHNRWYSKQTEYILSFSQFQTGASGGNLKESGVLKTCSAACFSKHKNIKSRFHCLVYLTDQVGHISIIRQWTVASSIINTSHLWHPLILPNPHIPPISNLPHSPFVDEITSTKNAPPNIARLVALLAIWIVSTSKKILKEGRITYHKPPTMLPE
jgi:hypothetical protein